MVEITEELKQKIQKAKEYLELQGQLIKRLEKVGTKTRQDIVRETLMNEYGWEECGIEGVRTIIREGYAVRIDFRQTPLLNTEVGVHAWITSGTAYDQEVLRKSRERLSDITKVLDQVGM
tara:strand:- start:787 stop:1146 length:360 start_codon:yes stop_codon:yes gene_type:complete